VRASLAQRRPTLNISPTLTNDAGSYRVIVTNAFGSARRGSIATLSVWFRAPSRIPISSSFITDDQRWDSMAVVQREMGANRARISRGSPTERQTWTASQRRGFVFATRALTLSLCSPSRAAIMTGKYNHLNGIIDNSTAFPTNSVTYASKLRTAGYVTGMVWQMAHGSAGSPVPVLISPPAFLGKAITATRPLICEWCSDDDFGWVDDVSTDYALAFINSNYTRPFALQLGYKSTHAPNDAPDWAANLYSNSVSRTVPNLNIPPPYRTNIANN
jgi:arylsulfatase A-like enzyme